jgi:hypothetical protein
MGPLAALLALTIPTFAPTFALATFVLAVFVFFTPVDPALLFVLRVGLRLRVALVFVVFGRVLRKAPRTSSSGSWALTIKRPQAKAAMASNVMKLLDLIYSSSDRQFEVICVQGEP